MKEYIVQTLDGRNISWAGLDKGHAKRGAEHCGHKVIRVLTYREWDRQNQEQESVNA